MTRKEQENFGLYLRQLREWAGLTLRDVEKMSGVSNGYISMLERETRNPPSPDILRRLASIYAVPAIELMRKAGILKPEDEGLDEENKLERAFQTVLSDPGFQHGTRLEGKMSRDVKLFIVEMYQKATGRKLL